MFATRFGVVMKKISHRKLGNISVALSSRIGHVVNNNGCKQSTCGLGSRLESSCGNPLVCQVLSSTQLKHMSSSVGMVLPNIWKVIKAMFQTTNQIMSWVVDVFPPELIGITFPDLNHLNHLCSSGIKEPE